MFFKFAFRRKSQYRDNLEQVLARTKNTVNAVLETTCIKRPPALRDYCPDTTTLLKAT